MINPSLHPFKSIVLPLNSPSNSQLVMSFPEGPGPLPGGSDRRPRVWLSAALRFGGAARGAGDRAGGGGGERPGAGVCRREPAG